LGVEADETSFKTLSDGRALGAALVARNIDRNIDLPLNNTRALYALCVRLVVQSYLSREIVSLALSPPTALPLSKDPLLTDLFAAATGTKDLDAGFRKLAANALNTSSIPKTDGRWRKISKARFDSMARFAPQKPPAAAEVDAIVAAVDRMSRTAPTGWVPIFKAFEAYRETNRTPLAAFKEAVEAAARADKLELAPLNVPSLQNDNERAQSALVMGGLTYHLVRLPK
jgi:hypothetical protein